MLTLAPRRGATCAMAAPIRPDAAALVASTCFAAAIPLPVLLALARQSSMGGLRTMAVVFIEVMRGTPMVAILYIAMLILPMMVSQWR